MEGIVTFTTIVLAVSSVTSQSLKASISMAGRRAEVTFQTSGSGVICTLQNEDPNFPATVGFAIHSGWMNYDMAEKCTAVGTPIPGRTGTFSAGAKTATITPASLDSLEGRTIVLTYGTTTLCGWITKEGNYITAVATFKHIVDGSVAFRQFDADGSHVLVMADLATDETFGGAAWKVTDAVDSCEDTASLASSAVYDPRPSQSPAVGDFSARFGAPVIKRSNNSMGSYYNSPDISLRGGHSIANKFLLIYDQQNASLIACSEIRLVQPLEATAILSHQGVSGHISFMQASPFDVTYTRVNLKGLGRNAKGYHVHLYPVPVQTQSGQSLCSPEVVSGHFDPYKIAAKGFPAPSVGTNDQYEIGDLSSKYGTLENQDELMQNYTDLNLPLFGRNSIVGRSLVIHRNDAAASRWMCTNINLNGHVRSGVAVFKYPIIGQVFFTQAVGTAYMETTWIFARLSALDDTLSSDRLWQINSKKVGDDMTAAGGSRCASTGSLFDPFKGERPLGDLSSKFGLIQIGTPDQFDPKAKAFYTDLFLPLSGKESIIGRSLVVRDAAGIILACATIEEFHRPSLKAEFNAGGISGHVSFMQEPVYGQTPTDVSVMLSGMEASKHNLEIHSLPPIEGDNPCSDLGTVYNPLGVVANGQAMTHDQYAVGDLLRGGSASEWMDLNLPLNGLTSIKQRSLVVVDKASKKPFACAVLQPPFSRSFNGYQVKAQTVFGPPLKGSIHMFQTLYRDGSTSDTSVLVNLMNADGLQTPDHNWHTHLKPVSGDASGTTNVCASTGPHYDPYRAKISQAATNYDTKCNMLNPLRCELGDQAKKLGTYSLGSGRKLYTDVDLPLNGMEKVQGRSFVIHVQNKGAARYACADINPVSSLAIKIKFKTPRELDLMEAARVYATAIKADVNDIVVEFISNIEEETTVNVHFLGLSRDAVRAKFLVYFGDSKNRQSLSKYAPLGDPNAAGHFVTSTALLLMALLINIVFFQL